MDNIEKLNIEVKKLYYNILEEFNSKIQELYDSELTIEDKKLISIEDFASMYIIDFQLDDTIFIHTNEIPKLKVILRLKTVEELLNS